MSELAILGGSPVRTREFAPWPQYLASDARRLQEVLESRHWGGFPVPSRYAGEFAERFAKMHGTEYALCVVNGTIALVSALVAIAPCPSARRIMRRSGFHNSFCWAVKTTCTT